MTIITTKNKKLWLIPVGALLLAAFVCGVFAYRAIQIRQSVPAANLSEEDDYDESGASSQNVLWNGKEYAYNDHLSNFLFLGIDQREPAETETGHADAGQSDALFLVTWDRVEEKINVISIPRDTMIDLEVFAYTGESLGKNKNHICLAYAYGDGKYESLNLAEQAVSSLFYGIPIQSSCAINLDALPILADSVDGVKVTVPNDSLEEKYPEFKNGSTVQLDAENTEAFVRYRNIDVSQSAITRLERQQVFLKAFQKKAMEKFSQDTEFIANLYTGLEPYMVSTTGKDQLVKLMESMLKGGDPKVWTVPGEGVQGEYYDEYIVDEEALYAKIMETFYKEVR